MTPSVVAVLSSRPTQAVADKINSNVMIVLKYYPVHLSLAVCGVCVVRFDSNAPQANSLGEPGSVALDADIADAGADPSTC